MRNSMNFQNSSIGSKIIWWIKAFLGMGIITPFCVIDPFMYPDVFIPQVIVIIEFGVIPPAFFIREPMRNYARITGVILAIIALIITTLLFAYYFDLVKKAYKKKFERN